MKTKTEYYIYLILISNVDLIKTSVNFWNKRIDLCKCLAVKFPLLKRMKQATRQTQRLISIHFQLHFFQINPTLLLIVFLHLFFFVFEFYWFQFRRFWLFLQHQPTEGSLHLWVHCVASPKQISLKVVFLFLKNKKKHLLF